MFYQAIVFLPLLGAIAAGLFSLRQQNSAAIAVSVSGVVISFILSLFAFAHVAMGGNTEIVSVARWINSGTFEANWQLRFDTLTAVMLIVVTGVSSCVHIYSVGYMHHDKAIARFMAYLSLFTFAMLMLVTADNLVQLFFGWEGVGVASYLLIGFWYHKESAHTAAMKAFVVNRVGDFGGGGMLLAFGMVCALLEARNSGQGQVVDAAMADGAAALMAGIYSAKGTGRWPNRPRGENWLDGGAHFYGSYQCADGNWICIGSIEPQFYDLLRQTLGLEGADWDDQWTPEGWPALKQKLADVFKTKSRAEWTEIMGDTDICFAPVMAMDEVLDHPHIAARETFVTADDVLQPAPAPRFSRTTPEIQSSPAFAGEHNEEVLAAWGFADGDIAALKATGALADPA